MPLPKRTAAKARKIVKAAKAGNPRALKKVAKSSIAQAAKKDTLVKTTNKRLDQIAGDKVGKSPNDIIFGNYGRDESRAKKISRTVGHNEGDTIATPAKNTNFTWSTTRTVTPSEAHQSKYKQVSGAKQIAEKKAVAAKLSTGAIKRAVKKGTKQATKAIKKVDKVNSRNDKISNTVKSKLR